MKRGLCTVALVLSCLGLVVGCAGVRDVMTWLHEDEVEQTTIELMGLHLLHSVGPGMEGSLHVTNGLTDEARSFTIDYEETPIAVGYRGVRSLPEKELKKRVPLLDVPDPPPPAYTQTPEAKLLEALNAKDYEYRSIYEGRCYSPAYLTAYEIVVLTPTQAECISVFRNIGYYVFLYAGFDGDFAALETFVDEVTR